MIPTGLPSFSAVDYVAQRKPRRFVKTFLPRFVPAIRAGDKRQTCRPCPKLLKDIPLEGDTFLLRSWEGLPYRSKQAILGEAEVLRVCPVFITETALAVDGESPSRTGFALADGFKSWWELTQFFAQMHGLPFDGLLFEWGDLK